VHLVPVGACAFFSCPGKRRRQRLGSMMRRPQDIQCRGRSEINTAPPRFPWLYLVLAYGLAWAFWIPVALTKRDYQGSPVLLFAVLVGVFGPGIAGIVLTYVELGRDGGQDFWRRAFDVRRIRPHWYAIILLLWPVLHAIAMAAHLLLGGSLHEFDFVGEMTAQPLGIPVVVILYLLQAGLEELGWRGYMLDRVQVRWSPTRASLVVGVCHALWHLPLFWVQGTNQIKYGFGVDFWLFVAAVLASSIYESWCYNSNRRSTLAATLLHTTGNLNLDVFTVPGAQHRMYTLLFVLGAVVVSATGLVRGERSTGQGS
jgi:membrane protease YdiL (CAAX protease family)